MAHWPPPPGLPNSSCLSRKLDDPEAPLVGCRAAGSGTRGPGSISPGLFPSSSGLPCDYPGLAPDSPSLRSLSSPAFPLPGQTFRAHHWPLSSLAADFSHPAPIAQAVPEPGFQFPNSNPLPRLPPCHSSKNGFCWKMASLTLSAFPKLTPTVFPPFCWQKPSSSRAGAGLCLSLLGQGPPT